MEWNHWNRFTFTPVIWSGPNEWTSERASDRPTDRSTIAAVWLDCRVNCCWCWFGLVGFAIIRQQNWKMHNTIENRSNWANEDWWSTCIYFFCFDPMYVIVLLWDFFCDKTSFWSVQIPHSFSISSKISFCRYFFATEFCYESTIKKHFFNFVNFQLFHFFLENIILNQTHTSLLWIPMWK